MIVITGSVQGRPEVLAELEQACLAHSRRSRAEPGCVSHAVHRDLEDPNRLVFVEQWRDAEAVRAHFAVPASQAFVAELAEWSTGPGTLTIAEAVSGLGELLGS